MNLVENALPDLVHSGNMLSMLVRRETGGDRKSIRAVHRAAFPTPEEASEPLEVGLVDALRQSTEWISHLSLVAETDGDVIGHVVASRGYLRAETNIVRAVGVGPVGVFPRMQKCGVGAALLHAVLGAAEAMDEPFAVLLGDPAYYARFGFQLAAEQGIEAPVATWQPHFQVRRFAAWRAGTTGTFHYAAPFLDT